MFHLLIAISGHGYGHLSQAAPVANAVAAACPGLRLTVRSALPEWLLRSRIRVPFELCGEADDFGLVQESTFEADLEASAAAYRRFHADWEARVEAAASKLRAIAPDLVLADVPYLTLAAAARAGIPSVALCSLNWADIYAHFFGRDAIHGQILDAYRSTELFLRPEPSMPMPDLGYTRAIGPVVEGGRVRRAELDTMLGLKGSEKIVLVALGGIRSRLPYERWPRLPGVKWLIQVDGPLEHPDACALKALEMPFRDILASVDLLITKPGYGSFVEAAALGLPVAYIPRSEWPEQPYLVRWMEQRGHAAVLPRTAAESGDIAGIVGGLLRGGRPRPIAATGAQEAAKALLRMVKGTSSTH